MRPPDLAGIRARVLLIRGRYDWMVPVEVSIAILNHIADSRLVLLNDALSVIGDQFDAGAVTKTPILMHKMGSAPVDV